MGVVGVHHTIAVHGDCVGVSGGGTDGQVQWGERQKKAKG